MSWPLYVSAYQRPLIWDLWLWLVCPGSIVMLQTTHSILSLPPSTTVSFYPHLADELQNQISHRNKYVSASAPDRAPLLPPEYPQASLQLHYGDLITLAARPETQVSPRAREKYT